MIKIYTFIFFLILENSISYFSIPFKYQDLPLNLDDDSLIKHLFFDAIFINVTIGSSNQIIPMKIKSSDNLFYIIDSNTTSYNGAKFDSNKSTTLEILNKKKISYIYEDIAHGILVNDNFKIGEKKINKLNFTLSNDLRKNSMIQGAGAIGLGVHTLSTKKEKQSFLIQLKTLNLIDFYTFTFYFSKKNEGNLIIGNYLYDIDKPYYGKEAFKDINCDNEFDNIYAIKSEFYIGKNELISFNLLFGVNLGLIIGSTDYLYNIQPDFFDSLISQGKCEKKSIDINNINILNYNEMKYIYFVCNKNINLKNFPPLIIRHIELSFNLEFTYEDLWMEYNNKKYFLVVFPDSTETEFYLSFLMGNIMFKKYDVTFDADRNIVGFYDKNKKYGNSNKFLYLLFFAILIGAFLYFISVIKKYRKRMVKKKLAHELEEEGFFSSLKN